MIPGQPRLLVVLIVGAALIGSTHARTETARAEGSEGLAPLPDPLTLEAALAFADRPHPDTDLARAELDIARLELERDRLLDTPRIHLDVTARVAEPAVDDARGMFDDSMVRLQSTQIINNFGRTRARDAIARSRVAEREIRWRHAQRMHRCKIVRRYLNVLLADLRYSIDNESMAVAFLRYDRMRERRESFDSVSEIDLLEAESAYHDALVRRSDSQSEQRRTRLLLAAALGRPRELPRELTRPDVTAWTGRVMPDPEPPNGQDLAGSLVIQAARQRLSTARAELAMAHVAYRPKLRADLQVSDYERPREPRDQVRSSLSLSVPLERDHEVEIARSLAEAEVRRADAQLRQAEQELRQTVSDLIERLQQLEIERTAADIHERYRDVYVDRSRTLYEMEVRADLGDAQARLLEATWRSMRVDFDIVAAWARLDCLLGRAIIPADFGDSG